MVPLSLVWPPSADIRLDGCECSRARRAPYQTNGRSELWLRDCQHVASPVNSISQRSYRARQGRVLWTGLAQGLPVGNSFLGSSLRSNVLRACDGSCGRILGAARREPALEHEIGLPRVTHVSQSSLSRAALTLAGRSHSRGHRSAPPLTPRGRRTPHGPHGRRRH